MRELPRKLSVEELAELFEGRTRLVERLAELENPLEQADEVVAALDDVEKVEALAAHPAIGQRSGLSARSAEEQGSDADPVVLSELAYLNQVYEEKFGFRFVVFVERPPEGGDPGGAPRAHREHARGGARHRLPGARRDREGSMDPYLRDVLDVILRMLHVVAGIAWIGASFYFVRLDLALRAPKRREDADAGVAGEFWGVHGGGLYHSQKYRLAPAEMPEPLHWFKWEAYTTWLSGFALMIVLYYFDAGVRLVDADAADLEEWQAIALSVGGIALAWIVYDVLCRTVGQRSQVALAVIGTGLVALAAWGAGELFAPRAAYLQVGAMLGTIMAANVFFVIIPAHRKLVAAMEEKREPDAAPLLEAKNRSVHNNYLTLPGALHDARRPLRVRVRRGRGVARLRRHRSADGAHPRVLQPLARGAPRLVDPGGRRSRCRRAGVLAAARGGRLRCQLGRLRSSRSQPVIAERCATCHSGVSAPLGVRLRDAGGDRSARSTTSSARRC